MKATQKKSSRKSTSKSSSGRKTSKKRASKIKFEHPTELYCTFYNDGILLHTYVNRRQAEDGVGIFKDLYGSKGMLGVSNDIGVFVLDRFVKPGEED